MVSEDETKKEGAKAVKADTSTSTSTSTTAQKYRSCPIKVDSLRNSLRTSIDSKRDLMTHSELQFVEGVLQKSLDEDQLENTNEVLRCDQTFFHHHPTTATTTTTTTDEHDGPTSHRASPEPALEAASDAATKRCSTPDCSTKRGSKKRQDYLEARKKQAAEQSKKRATAMWKKVSIVARTVAQLSSASSQEFNREDNAKGTKGEEDFPEKEKGSIKEDDDDDDDDKDEPQEEEEEQEGPKTTVNRNRPVFLKQASINVYGGEGIEIGAKEDLVSDNAGKEETKEATGDKDDDQDQIVHSFAALSAFDETTHTSRGEGFRRASCNIYGGKGFEVAGEELFDAVYDGNDRKAYEYYDPWLFQETDKTGKRRTFNILGTSHDDSDCHPHVLSPVQMDRLQPFLPDTKKGESFWLKYSLVRDGASNISFLKQVRASPYTLLAMETVDGEVFGGFFSSAWTVKPNYFGTGESFLWKMKRTRKLPSCGDDDENLSEQIDRESDLEIFPSKVYYGNRLFQMCHRDKIAAGGGTTSFPQEFGTTDDDLGDAGTSGSTSTTTTYAPHEIGVGLQLGGDGSLLEGSSEASLTFRNPPLARAHNDGSKFELVNLEAWGFTPCQTEEEARILEYKNMFFKRNASSSGIF